MNLDLSTRVVRSTEPMTATVSDEVLMFSAERGRYYGLNSVASAMWQRMATPVTIGELCADLQKTFDVPADCCTTEVLTFLDLLLEKRLAQVVV